MGILESINLFCFAIILISNKCEASVVDIEGYMKVKKDPVLIVGWWL